MNPVARLSLVDRADVALSIVTQCRLLKVARSSLYWRPAAVSEDDLRLMRRIDELYQAAPFHGARRMMAVLCREGWTVNRKRVRRLMRAMRIEAIYQKPNTSRRHPDHVVYPYLLRGLAIDRPNQVWCADITYVPLAKGFVYLVAVMDWFSRRVLSWRLSTGMDTGFCVEALREALDRYGSPDIFNTDQGVQFTSAAFTGVLAASGVRIGMDGSVLYSIAVMGEAAKGIGPAFKASHPDIPCARSPVFATGSCTSISGPIRGASGTSSSATSTIWRGPCVNPGMA